MRSQFPIILFLTGVLWTASIPVTLFNHARFTPINISTILDDLSSISSQQACLCHCLRVAMCTMITYFDVVQRCVVYSTTLEGGQLQLMADNTVTSVIGDRTDGDLSTLLSNVKMITASSTDDVTEATTPSVLTSTSIASVSSMSHSRMFKDVIFSVSACTTLITFDDLPTGSGLSTAILDGYKNLNWINLEYINASSMPIDSGYKNVKSLPIVAHNPSENNVTISAMNGT
jgi:hypothetical protein